MTTLDPLHPLQSSILEELAASPGLSIEAIHTQLTTKLIEVSRPNLYRIIGQMIEVQMLVKDKGKLSLNHAWIPHILAFAETIRSNYLEEKNISAPPLQEGERRDYTAESLRGLDPIWFHILLGCADNDSAQEWYAYNSHPWHVIGMSDTELRGYNAITAKHISCHMMYGNNTFLDQYGAKLVRIKNFQASVCTDIPLPKSGYAIWICGDYIIECLMPDSLSKRFDYFFEHVKNIKEFQPDIFADIFHMKAHCKVTIRRHEKEADTLRTMFIKYVNRDK